MKKFLSVCLSLSFLLNVNVFAKNNGYISADRSIQKSSDQKLGWAKKIALYVGGLALTVGGGAWLIGKCFSGSSPDTQQTGNTGGATFSSPYGSFWRRLSSLSASEIKGDVSDFQGKPENISVIKANVPVPGKANMWPNGIVDGGLLDYLCKYGKTAIIDASNSSGLGGGGVDGCIFRAMGPKAVRHVEANVPTVVGVRIPEGGAVIHSSCEIARQRPHVPYVVQTVSPHIVEPQHKYYLERLNGLYSAYYQAVTLAIDSGCTRILVPPLGLGYFWQAGNNDDLVKKCARVALKAISDARKAKSREVDVIFVDYQIDSAAAGNNAQGAIDRNSAFFKELKDLDVKQIDLPKSE